MNANGNKATAIAEVSNDAESTILLEAPYVVDVEVIGSAPMLFHRWNVDAVAERQQPRKARRQRRKTTSNRMCTEVTTVNYPSLVNIFGVPSFSRPSTNKTHGRRAKARWIFSRLASLA